MKHKHIFKKVGGSCEPGKMCDIHYKCDCGEEIFAQMSTAVYWVMHREWEIDAFPPAEIKVNLPKL